MCNNPLKSLGTQLLGASNHGYTHRSNLVSYRPWDDEWDINEASVRQSNVRHTSCALTIQSVKSVLIFKSDMPDESSATLMHVARIISACCSGISTLITR